MHIQPTNFLRILYWTVIANFIAQVPYYIHQYYLKRHLAPSIIGIMLLTMVLGWFLLSYKLLKQAKKVGYFAILLFIIVESLFYLQTQIVQSVTGHGILLHVLHPDNMLLFFVFLIGYINFIADVYFIAYLVKYRKVLCRDW